MGLKSLHNINAIPVGAALLFGEGLTIIYGENGTGKSGFARLLSTACFSRSKLGILPNVYRDAGAPPSAEIVIKEMGAPEQTIHFTEGLIDPRLQRLSVFNTDAQNYLSGENKLGFHPTGFDVFDEMVRTIGCINTKLDEAMSHLSTENIYSPLFAGESAVANTINALNKDSNIDALHTMAIYADTERSRLVELDREILDLTTLSPAELIQKLETAIRHIVEARDLIAGLVQKLGREACDKFRTQLQTLKASLSARESLKPEGISHPKAWLDFGDTARTYGRTQKDNFPELGDACLLCNRPLDEPSVTLIRKFWGFLDHEARKAAEAANQQVEMSIRALETLKADILPDDSLRRHDLSQSQHDTNIVSILDTIRSNFIARKNTLIKAMSDGNIQLIPDNDVADHTAALNEAIVVLERQIAALSGGSIDERLLILKAERLQLQHREILSQRIDEIVAFVERLRWLDRAKQKKRSALTTRFITDKQRELFSRIIEGRYKERLSRECEKLKCTLPFALQTRGSGGTTLLKLALDGGYKPTQIFSEGEQKALALADFLTEVNLNPASSAIALDDPVTSMDHARKKLIAARLVEEATVRQVIIFTHDLVFLSQLLEAAKALAIEPKTHWVQASDNIPGKVALNDAPLLSDAYKNTNLARESLRLAHASAGSEQVTHVRTGAGKLRRTIEEIIIAYLFKGVVKRWDEQVRIGALSKITWSQEAVDEIVQLQDD